MAGESEEEKMMRIGKWIVICGYGLAWVRRKK